ncbi:hypothetical protein BGZ83_007557 [Gryganskiella cystojenkinii]|nr:hypothetical protein BGZ83_007557 [Gryganskiella cystojenkinii]
MSPTVQEALTLARTNIDAARGARGFKRRVVKHYQTAKNVLDNVNIQKTDNAALGEIIAAFQDLANVLDDSGAQFQDKTAKCRQRAVTLKHTLVGRKVVSLFPLAMAGFSRPGVQTGVTQLSSFAGVTLSSSNPTPNVSSVSASTTASSNALTAAAVTNTSTPGQLASFSPRVAISISAACAIISSPFFSKDVIPVPYICQLPRPDEPLQTTRQLAHCLALLQDGNDLSPETCEWRDRTLKNSDEKDRLETLSVDINRTFVGDAVKDAAAIAEVVQLAPVLNEEYSRVLLKTFIDAVNKSAMLDIYSVAGLAKVIQGAAPGSVNSDDLVSILRSLHNRLRATHSQSESNQHHLLLAVSRVLDAMADANIGDVDRVNLHGPLTDLLSESDSNNNPYVAYQAAYATQALLNVSDNENIWHAGFRRGWLVLKGSAGFAKMADPKEIKDALEGMERLYEAGQGGARMLKDALEAIKNRESPTFTVKEGLKFKRAWYRAIRTAESYIQTGKLLQFKELVTTAPCRHQLMFQWGICLLLGKFAADTQWGPEARQDAVIFLGALHRVDGIWNRQKEADQVIFDGLTNVISKDCTYFEAAKTILEEMREQSFVLNSITNFQSQPWSNIWPTNPDGHTASAISLLQVVQKQNIRHKKLENLPDHDPQPRLEDIQLALTMYYAKDLFILRVSGDPLDLQTCFVNLAIVEAPAQREKEKQDLKEQAAVFHRISDFEKVKGTNMESPIPLEKIFDRHKLRDGKEGIPKRILVQGRAGIGKSTLCKKLVYAFQNGLWNDSFNAVLWLPLRQLKGFTARNLEDLLCEKYFAKQHPKTFKVGLAQTLANDPDRILFILDGLDEIITDPSAAQGTALNDFLQDLLEQQHVILTSRPSGVNSSTLKMIDLELETVGFSQKDVQEYLRKIEPKAAIEIQNFIDQTPLLQGIVNIPVQLDVLCYSWDTISSSIGKDKAITMTMLYQAMNNLSPKNTNIYAIWHSVDFKTTALNTAQDKSKDMWYFLHLTFQEFFAAKWLVRHLQEYLTDPSASTSELMLSCKETLEIVQQDKYNPRYEIIWWMVAGLLQGKALKDFFDLFQGAPRDLIGGRHQQIFSACLNEARTQLDPEVVALFDLELTKWLHFEMQTCQHNNRGSKLGSQSSFPEVILVKTLNSVSSWRKAIVCTLGARSAISDSAVQSLLLALKDKDHYTSSSAAAALRSQYALSESAIQPLIAALKDEYFHTRKVAAEVLGRQPTLPESAIQSLFAAFEDEFKGIRREFIGVKEAIAEALGKQSSLPESAIPNLIAALKVDTKYVWSTAIAALGKQSTLSESAIQSLIAALKDDDKCVRSSVASALGNQSTLSESAIQSLIAALKDDDKYVRFSAAKALGKQSSLSESAIQSLIAALKNDDNFVRSSAAEALGNQSTLSESAIQSLIAAFNEDNDDNEYVRSSAASALGNQSTLPELAIHYLIAAFKDDRVHIRDSAALALGKQSILSESAIRSLIAAVKDDDKYVRSSAAEALGKQSTLSESATQTLIAALKDDKNYVRSRAAEALGNQSTLSESAIQSLIATLKNEDGKYDRDDDEDNYEDNGENDDEDDDEDYDEDEGNDEDVMSSAASALSNHSTLSESAIQLLIAALKDEYDYTRQLPAQVLGYQSTLSESAIQSLIAAFKDEHEYVRDSAALALGEQSILPESAIHSLIAALKDDNKHVRYSAALALRNQSMLPTSAIQSLIAALKDEFEGVRESAAKALGKQSSLSESAIQSLITALKDNDEDVRFSVSTALWDRCISDNRLHFYTEQGPVYSELIDSDKEEIIVSAFKVDRGTFNPPRRITS